MIVNLDSYRAARASRAPGPDRYGDELLYANWNPVVGVIAALQAPVARDLGVALPEDWSQVDVDAFLSRIYALATQI